MGKWRDPNKAEQLARARHLQQQAAEYQRTRLLVYRSSWPKIAPDDPGFPVKVPESEIPRSVWDSSL